ARYDVWVMNADGSGARFVAHGRGSGTGPGSSANTAGPMPDWSPDGKRLVFDTQDASGLPAVWVVGSDGTGLRRLQTGVAAQRPAWSPDGRRIAFGAALAGARAGIWVAGADGSHARQVTRGRDSNPSWSRDGGSIVFD